MRFAGILLSLIPYLGFTQSLRIDGAVRGPENEALPLAHVVLMPDSNTTVCGRDGRFTMWVSGGEKIISVSYTGFQTQTLRLTINSDTTVNFSLPVKIDQLQEVVVTGERDRYQEVFESTRTSTNSLTGDVVESIPVLGGEADPIKVLQLLPGTLRGVEGSSDLFVRGGAADQNLVLLDGATVYNTSHLFGFISVFNPDILESVESVNGGFPANIGGRLSSIIDVTTRSTVAESPGVSGDVGLIASRLFVEAPIIQDRLSVWVAGRRTYIDRVAKLAGEEVPYFFYDLNAKVIARPSSKDMIAFTIYNGEDDLNLFRDRNNDGRGFLTTYKSGNNSMSIQWNRELNSDWQTTLTLLRTSYNYNILNSFEDNRVVAFSDIRDIGGKLTLGQTGEGIFGKWESGIEWTRHDVSPSIVNSSGTIAEFVSSSSSSGKIANEVAPFVLNEWSVGDRWLFNTGLRTSITVVPGKTFLLPEPRVSVRFKVNDDQALKFSYSRMVQSIHRVSNSAITSPTDIWYPVTDSLEPQRSHQLGLAWQRTFSNKGIFLSMETYYKAMENLVGFNEGTNLFFNNDFESDLIQGKGRAVGLELLLRKQYGRLTGWISYTLSRSTRQFDGINNGNVFPARYDRRHNGAIVAQYELSKRWYVSMVWEYISGARFTPIIGKYIIAAPTSAGVDILPVFAPTNSVKLSDTHRLDLGVKFKSKPGRKFRYEWFAGAYNVYNRSNPVAVAIETNPDGSLRYEQVGVFGFLPFISYKFSMGR